MRAAWTPGECRALVWPASAALVAPVLDDESCGRFWDSKASETLPLFLEALGDVLSVGLLSLPDFAVVFTDTDHAHIACRGRFTVVLDHADGRSDLSGADVSTWVERRLPLSSVEDVKLIAPGASEGSPLPITGGVVPAGALILSSQREVIEAAVDGARSGRGGVSEVPVAVAPALQPADPRVTLVEPEVSGAGGVAETADERSDPATVDPVEEQPHLGAQSESEVSGDADASNQPRREGAGGRFAVLLADHTYSYDIEQAAVRADELADAAPDSAQSDERRDRENAPPGRDIKAILDEGQAEKPRVKDSALPSPPTFISSVPGPSRTRRDDPSSTHATPVARAGPAQGGGTVEDDISYHDDLTMMELPYSTLTERSSPHASEVDDVRVRGLKCTQGHGNPPQRTECRVCGARLDGAVVEMERPAVGWLHTSAGESIPLTGNILAGRAPRASKFQGTQMPTILPIPHGHVSSTHLEIKVEGWNVLALDLGSTNGTFLQREGQPTTRLSEAPHLLASNDVLNLGHGVTLRFEELP